MKKSLIVLFSFVIAWFVVSEAATEAWYRWHEMRAAKSPEWTVTWPDEPESDWKVEDFTEFPTSDQVQEVLRYDEMRGARWVDPASRGAWSVNFIEWEPDKNLNGINAVHNPTICLPGAGMQLVKALGERNQSATQTVRFGGESFLNFQHSKFQPFAPHKPHFPDTENLLREFRVRITV